MLESLHVPFAVTVPMKLTQRLALALSALTIAAAAHAAPLRIGVTPGALADSVEVAAAEARKQGLDVKVVELTDWTTPNVALASGDLDLNYFQHQAFLDNAIKERGYAFKSVGIGVLGNIGLYSSKINQSSYTNILQHSCNYFWGFRFTCWYRNGYWYWCVNLPSF